MIRLALVPLEPGLPLELTTPVSLLGRGADCDLQVNDRTISKRHVAFVRDDRRCWFRDLASTNGCRINGRKELRSALEPGDIFTAGSVKFRLVHGDDVEREIARARALMAGGSRPDQTVMNADGARSEFELQPGSLTLSGSDDSTPPPAPNRPAPVSPRTLPGPIKTAPGWKLPAPPPAAPVFEGLPTGDDGQTKLDQPIVIPGLTPIRGSFDGSAAPNRTTPPPTDAIPPLAVEEYIEEYAEPPPPRSAAKPPAPVKPTPPARPDPPAPSSERFDF
jgi:hypothetical protein